MTEDNDNMQADVGSDLMPTALEQAEQSAKADQRLDHLVRDAYAKAVSKDRPDNDAVMRRAVQESPDIDTTLRETMARIQSRRSKTPPPISELR